MYDVIYDSYLVVSAHDEAGGLKNCMIQYASSIGLYISGDLSNVQFFSVLIRFIFQTCVFLFGSFVF